MLLPVDENRRKDRSPLLRSFMLVLGYVSSVRMEAVLCSSAKTATGGKLKERDTQKGRLFLAFLLDATRNSLKASSDCRKASAGSGHRSNGLTPDCDDNVRAFRPALGAAAERPSLPAFIFRSRSDAIHHRLSCGTRPLRWGARLIYCRRRKRSRTGNLLSLCTNSFYCDSLCL